jgi:hypothetical protein
MSSNKFRTAGTLLKKAQPLLGIVLKGSLDYVGALLEACARKSLRRLSQQSDVSQSSVEAAKNCFV